MTFPLVNWRIRSVLLFLSGSLVKRSKIQRTALALVTLFLFAFFDRDVSYTREIRSYNFPYYKLA